MFPARLPSEVNKRTREALGAWAEARLSAALRAAAVVGPETPEARRA